VLTELVLDAGGRPRRFPSFEQEIYERTIAAVSGHATGGGVWLMNVTGLFKLS
jgi:hypothetical protein